MRILKQSQSAEKLESGDPLGFLKLHFTAKYQNLEGGPFGDKKMGKKSHSAENNLKEDPVDPSGFVSYVKN